MFEIVKIERFGNYVLKDLSTGEQKDLVMQFFEINPSVGDKILLHNKVFDKTIVSFSQPYAFAPTKEKIELKEDKIINIDTAILIANNKKIMLKRIYG